MGKYKDSTSVTRGKKKSEKPQNGEMHVARSHNVRKVTVAKDHGTKKFSPEGLGLNAVEGALGEVGCNIERTVQPEQFEALRVGVSCRLPCSVDDLQSGKAFKVVHAMCRKELGEQLARGLEGLESPFRGR